MTKPNSTEIIVVLDRSGSMTAIAADMEGGFDTLIEEQKKLSGECRVTLTQFDTEHEVVYSNVAITEVPKLKVFPRGGTALFDALGKTINVIGERLSKTPESDRPSQVMFVVITDGEENASKEFVGNKQVHDMIQHQRDKYKWEFIFLGANQDSLKTAKNLGISTSNSVTYSSTQGGTHAVMRGLSAGIGQYRSSGQQSMNNVFNQKAYDALINQQPAPQSPLIITATPNVHTKDEEEKT